MRYCLSEHLIYEKSQTNHLKQNKTREIINILLENGRFINPDMGVPRIPFQENRNILLKIQIYAANRFSDLKQTRIEGEIFSRSQKKKKKKTVSTIHKLLYVRVFFCNEELLSLLSPVVLLSLSLMHHYYYYLMFCIFRCDTVIITDIKITAIIIYYSE